MINYYFVLTWCNTHVIFLKHGPIDIVLTWCNTRVIFLKHGPMVPSVVEHYALYTCTNLFIMQNFTFLLICTLGATNHLYIYKRKFTSQLSFQYCYRSTYLSDFTKKHVSEFFSKDIKINYGRIITKSRGRRDSPQCKTTTFNCYSGI